MILHRCWCFILSLILKILKGRNQRCILSFCLISLSSAIICQIHLEILLIHSLDSLSSSPPPSSLSPSLSLIVVIFLTWTQFYLEAIKKHNSINNFHLFNETNEITSSINCLTLLFYKLLAHIWSPLLQIPSALTKTPISKREIMEGSIFNCLIHFNYLGINLIHTILLVSLNNHL